MSGVTVMAVVLASCSSSSGSGWSGSAATRGSVHAPAPTTSAQPLKLLRPLNPLKQPSARRGAPHANATLVRFNTADRISLDGTMIGTGTVGVVLAHEYDNDLCGACPFAKYPAKRGLRPFAVDVRCFGRSAGPQGDAAGWVVDDLVAAVAQLRQRGVTRVALVGASMGGSAALIAATRVEPPVDPVVELSGQAKPTSLLRIPLNGRGAVQQLTVPTIFVLAKYDQHASVDDTRATYQANKTADERLLLLLPGQFDGFRGRMVLHSTSGGFSSTTTEVVAFIAAHTPRPLSESLVTWHNGSQKLRPVGRDSGLDAQMPSKHGPGCVHRRCLRWRWRSWVVATATAEMTYQVSADQLAVVEAAGKYAPQVGLIGDCAIASFNDIAAGLISRARSTEVFSGCLDIERERRARAVVRHATLRLQALGPVRRAPRGSSREPARVRSAGASGAFAGGAGVLGAVVTATVQGISTSRVAMLTLRGSTPSRGGGRRLRRSAGVVIEGRSGGRRGDSRRPPACRPGLGRSGDAPRIGRRAGDGSGR